FQTPEEAAQQAVDKKVDLVAASSLAAGHLTLIPALREALQKLEASDIRIVVGGVVPPEDVMVLKQMGAVEVFGPGSVIAQSALALLRRLGVE
ncbi:MAG TPA: methylmalonyl-CoA mutase, partial [Alphaproteobacteria bacterium]|nr:methylmalonyl-CoA mutase [Alphaproteobacteria bacterium]